MKVFKFIKATAAIIAVTLTVTACNFIAGGRTGETSQTQSSSADGFYDRIEASREVNMHVITSEPIKGGLEDVLDEIRPTVVEIYGYTGSGTQAGSGVIVDLQDTDGNGTDDLAYIITCHHVIGGARETTVKTLYGNTYEASLIGSDPKSDIGIIAINAGTGNSFEGLKLASWYNDSDSLRVGMSVVAIGNPLGTLGGTVTKGIISAISRDVIVEGRKMNLLQTDAAINGGNSGGGLFDVNTGALVGIVNAGYAAYAADGINFAIPSNTAKYIESLLCSTYDPDVSFGFIKGNYDFGVEFGLTAYSSGWGNRTYYAYIESLDEYGTFAKGGLKVNDVIYSIEIGGKSLDISGGSSTAVSELTEFLSGNFAVGDSVKVTYGRSSSMGRTTSYTVTFNILNYVYGG